MKALFKIFTVVATAAIFSCSGGDDELPSNEIRDDDGLSIQLEWNTGGSTSQSISDADLDLRLYKDATLVESSLAYYSFEDVEIKNIYADGGYTIEIDVVNISKAASYKVFINGKKSGTTKQYDGTVAVSEEGAKIEFIKVTKQGTRYTLSR